MTKLSKKDVLHVAKLAKLDLSLEEEEKFASQLSEVLDYVGQLGEVDTEEVEPTSQTTGLENVFCPDELKSQQGLSQEEALSGTEKNYNGYFKVEAILSERTDK